MRPKLHVRRDDTVQVISGSSRGARGRVLRTIPERRKVVVEGVNLVWKHIHRSRERPRGGRIQIEAPIDVSNVMLICPNRDCARHDKPVRIRRAVQSDGTRIRVCASCGAEIPRPE
ncbi:MAG: 50S ribosomal protein L24 [Planctomycetota bacterium]|jgi:large subunit ribosomal protein L24